MPLGCGLGGVHALHELPALGADGVLPERVVVEAPKVPGIGIAREPLLTGIELLGVVIRVSIQHFQGYSGLGVIRDDGLCGIRGYAGLGGYSGYSGYSSVRDIRFIRVSKEQYY